MLVFRAIKNQYGSKQGLMWHCIFFALHQVGFYNRFKKIDFSRVARLVFVCQGNICRSPLGEAVARSSGVRTCSFGLNTRSHDPADPRAVAWGVTRGYDLHSHLTTSIEDYVPEQGDLLIGMEPKHAKQLLLHFSDAPVQITIAGLWLDTRRVYLHDPYNTNSSYFDLCEKKVELATLAILKKYSEKVISNSRDNVYE